jgi:hypothetical protein
VPLVMVDGVEVAEQQHARPVAAVAAQAQQQIGRVVGGRARRAFDGGLLGRKRGRHRRALLEAVHVAAGRGDGDQSGEVALEPGNDVRGVLHHPGVHGIEETTAERWPGTGTIEKG